MYEFSFRNTRRKLVTLIHVSFCVSSSFDHENLGRLDQLYISLNPLKSELKFDTAVFAILQLNEVEMTPQTKHYLWPLVGNK